MARQIDNLRCPGWKCCRYRGPSHWDYHLVQMGIKPFWLHLTSGLQKPIISDDEKPLVFHMRSSSVKNRHFYVRFTLPRIAIVENFGFFSSRIHAFWSSDERWGKMSLFLLELDNYAAGTKMLSATLSSGTAQDCILRCHKQHGDFFCKWAKIPKIGNTPNILMGASPLKNSDESTFLGWYHRLVRNFELAFIGILETFQIFEI